jgi:serine/threonine protein kinase/tetratricopeptide (TPR) repeat protein
MTDDPRVQQLLDELLNGHTTPEEVCRSCPELLPLVRQRWRQMCRLRADLDVLLPPPVDADTMHQPTITPAAPRPATPTIPGYELLEEIGRGGMGVVHRARDLAFDRDVAVKLLPDPHMARSPAARRFLDEARITGQLQHPSIPAVYQVGALADGRPFLAMKLIKGRTLAALLEQRPDSAADRGRLVAIFEHICQAVAYAHAHRVIHRDLKPGNVMVGKFGEVQVMDWGLAKVLPEPGVTTDAEPVRKRQPADDGTVIRDPRAGGADTPGEFAGSTPQTRAGSVLGTPAYMSPEQAGGDMDRLDERCDVFGLGAVLCEILTGDPPYTGRDADQTYRWAMGANQADAHTRLDACGAEPELVGLCRWCLAPEPADRPRDAAEVARAVAEFRAAAEERARRAELDRVRAVELSKRRRVQAALAVAVALLVCGGGAVAWWQDRQAGARRAQLARNADALDVATGVCEQALRDGDAERAAVALGFIDRRLAEGGGEAARDRAERCRADLAILRELDRIDTFRWTWVENKFPDPKVVAAQWQAALAGYGVVLGETPVEEVARRLAGSLVRDRLLAILDLWLVTEPSAGVREILRAADPDPYRDAVRDAVAARERKRVGELAGRPDALAQPPRFAAALGQHRAVPADRARAVLGAALRSRPGDLALLMTLGNSYPLKQREWVDDRLRWFQAAVAAHPRSAAAHTNLGAALLDKGDLDGAAACCREAVRLDPTLAIAHNILGNVLRGMGDRDGAIACYREAMRLDPKYAITHINLGNALRDKGDLDGAIAYFKAALRLDPTFAPAHNNLGIALRDKGDVDGAIGCYRRAILLNPALLAAHINLGNALHGKGDVDGAIACYKEAIRLDPKYAAAHTNLGNALRGKGDVDGAIACYKEALRLDPKEARTHYNLGNTLGGKDDADGAIACYKEAIRLDPKYAAPYTTLGIFLARKGDRDGAAAAYREAIRLDPADLLAHNFLAGLLARRGDPRAALELLRQGARANPGWLADPASGVRYNSACFACLAAATKGADAPPPDARPALRKEALDWLTADLTAWRERLAANPAKHRTVVHDQMAQWLTDPDLRSVREQAELANLPVEERAGWAKLWAEVRDLRDATATPKDAPPQRDKG